MDAIFKKLALRQRSRSSVAESALASAARDHAAGQAVDVVATEKMLFEAGLQVTDFEAMCSVAAARREAFSIFEKLASAKSAARKAEAAIESENNKFGEVQQSHFARLEKLHAKLSGAEGSIQQAESARSTLIDPKNNFEPLRSRLIAANKELADAQVLEESARREDRECRRRIEEEDRWIRSNLKAAGVNLLPAGPFSKSLTGVPDSVRRDNEIHELSLSRARDRLAEIKPRLKAAEKARSAAEAEVVALEREALRQ